MCVSRLHRVVALVDNDNVMVVDLDGREYPVSLLVLDDAAPSVGDWLVVHSGYAIERVESEDARRVSDEISAARAHPDERK